MANASQHLQALRQAALVESRKDGLFVYYRLADPDVFELSKVIRSVAERRLADFERLVEEHFGNRADAEPVPMDELLKRARSKQVVILDTRPASEYAAGHIPGAISIPVDDLQRRLKELGEGQGVRGVLPRPLLRLRRSGGRDAPANGRRARRLVEGFPEWRSAGLPISRGTEPGALR